MPASLIANFSLALFLVGIACASFQPPHPSTWFYAGVVVAFIMALRWPPWWIVVAFGLGFSYTSLWRAHYYTDYTFGETVTLAGRIVEPPDIRQDSIFLTVQPEETSTRILVTTNRYPTYNFGQLIRLEGKLEKPEAFEKFNYPLYLERFHIYAIARKPTIEVLDHSAPPSLRGHLFALRTILETRIQATLPEPESSFLGGVLLGSKRAIPTSIQDALRQTGTSHIIAISGANITILLGIVLQVLPLTGRRMQLLATALIGLGIVVMTGASASVVRGAVVACLGRYLKLYSRRAYATPFVLFSMTLLLANNPLMLIADPGFQLSFAAFAGLAYLGSPLSTFLQHFRLTRSWPDIIRAPFAETTAATLGTALISLHSFGQLSLLGLIVNPLVLWLLPAIMALGLIVLAFGWIPGVTTILALPLWLLLHSVLQIVTSFGKVNFGVIHIH